jgi:biotin operon repressor
MEKKLNRNSGEVLRDEMYMRDRIAGVLLQGPRTVPELAAELGYPSAEVLKWLTAMRRYGLVIELPKAKVDDYYQYKLKDEA